MDPIAASDRMIGRAVERSMIAHHRRRLRKLDRLEALDPPDDGSPWCREAPPPRAGSAIEVLIDGAAVLPAVAAAIRSATRSVRIAGWHSAPHFALERREPPTVLRELLADAVARGVTVRMLLWAGAPFRVFTPARAAVRADAEELERGTGVRVAVDARERLLHCHHEKLVVVDDEVAFVNGVDLTDLGGDRWDTPEHPARGRLGWHDAGTRLRGPIVADVAEHLDLRWTAVTGERLPPVPVPAPAGDTTVQLLRTIPEGTYDEIARGAFGVLEGYMRALRSARELVYLESQFFWLPEIVHVLSEKLREPPDERFRIVVLLPSKANNGEEDTRGMLAYLADADAGRGRFLATTIDALTGSTVDRVYVHAKIGIVDDRWLTIGSANLNAHSFFNDTEVNVAGLRSRARARDAAAAVERAPRAAGGRDRRATRPRSSTTSGSRSRGASASARTPGSGASTGCASSARARARSNGCSGRWTRSSSTAERRGLTDVAPRERGVALARALVTDGVGPLYDERCGADRLRWPCAAPARRSERRGQCGMSVGSSASPWHRAAAVRSRAGTAATSSSRPIPVTVAACRREFGSASATMRAYSARMPSRCSSIRPQSTTAPCTTAKRSRPRGRAGANSA